MHINAEVQLTSGVLGPSNLEEAIHLCFSEEMETILGTSKKIEAKYCGQQINGTRRQMTRPV